MKVLIYDNKEKDKDKIYFNQLISLLNNNKIEYKQLEDCDLCGKEDADAIFTLGGDGTILWLVEFANRNSIPIIGINAGKLGFLSEFETAEMEEAVSLFKDGLLKKDERLTLQVSINGETFHALNDAYIQRLYSKEIGCMTADIAVSIGGSRVERFKGDGVVVSTPTGSTAYSLSAGGPVISPDIDALSVTPIAAHALGHRTIVFSSDKKCCLELVGKAHGGLFVDGRLIAEIKKGDLVFIDSAKNKTIFLRRKEFNFFKRLSVKLKDSLDVE